MPRFFISLIFLLRVASLRRFSAYLRAYSRTKALDLLVFVARGRSTAAEALIGARAAFIFSFSPSLANTRMRARAMFCRLRLLDCSEPPLRPRAYKKAASERLLFFCSYLGSFLDALLASARSAAATTMTKCMQTRSRSHLRLVDARAQRQWRIEASRCAARLREQASSAHIFTLIAAAAATVRDGYNPR